MSIQPHNFARQHLLLLTLGNLKVRRYHNARTKFHENRSNASKFEIRDSLSHIHTQTHTHTHTHTEHDGLIGLFLRKENTSKKLETGIRIATKNSTTSLANCFDRRGYRTYWQMCGVNFITSSGVVC
jgi:hypothetical protein